MQIRALTAENGLDLHGFHEPARDGPPDDELFDLNFKISDRRSRNFAKFIK